MARYVISDASPLIGLAVVDGLAWLTALFGAAWIPPSVQRQVPQGVKARREPETAAAIKSKALRVWKKGTPMPTANIGNLDEGETDCIPIALSRGASSNTIILMDDRAGRAIANEHGIQVAGTAGPHPGQ